MLTVTVLYSSVFFILGIYVNIVAASQNNYYSFNFEAQITQELWDTLSNPFYNFYIRQQICDIKQHKIIKLIFTRLKGGCDGQTKMRLSLCMTI